MEDHLKTVDVNQGSSFSTTNHKNMKDFINFRCEQDEERGKREEFQFAEVLRLSVFGTIYKAGL